MTGQLFYKFRIFHYFQTLLSLVEESKFDQAKTGRISRRVEVRKSRGCSVRKSRGGEVTDVEDAILSRYSSQRQLRLDLGLLV